MGSATPQYHGVLRLMLRTDGELVLETVPHIGYLHAARRRSARAFPRTVHSDHGPPGLPGRDDHNNHAFSLTIEKLAG